MLKERFAGLLRLMQDCVKFVKNKWLCLKQYAAVKKAVIAAGLAAGVFVSAVILICLGSVSADYKRTAKLFVKLIENGDYIKAYNLLEAPQSEFLTLAAFCTALEEYENSAVCRIEAEDISKTAALTDSKRVKVNYTLKNGNVLTAQLKLKESADKYMLFFEKYRVCSDENMIARNVLLRMPKGVAVRINNVLLDETYEPELYKDSASAYVIYELPYAFIGKVGLLISGDNIETCESVIKINGSGEVIYFNPQTLKTKDTVFGELKARAVSDLQKIIAAGVENKPFNSISDITDDKYIEAVYLNYTKYVLNALHSNFKSYTGMEASNIRAVPAFGGYMADAFGNQVVQIKLSYDLKGTYVYGSLTDLSRQAAGSTSSSYISYSYDNGSWVISDFKLDIRESIR